MFWTEESIAFLRDAAAMNRYYETIAERIAPQLPENAHVCDAGCGIGELSLALKPYCRHVTAVDADALAIKTLKAHLIEGVTARCGDMETLAPERALRRDGVLSLWPHAGYITHREKAVPRENFPRQAGLFASPLQCGTGKPRRVHGGEYGSCPARKGHPLHGGAFHGGVRTAVPLARGGGALFRTL